MSKNDCGSKNIQLTVERNYVFPLVSCFLRAVIGLKDAPLTNQNKPVFVLINQEQNQNDRDAAGAGFPALGMHRFHFFVSSFDWFISFSFVLSMASNNFLLLPL